MSLYLDTGRRRAKFYILLC